MSCLIFLKGRITHYLILVRLEHTYLLERIIVLYYYRIWYKRCRVRSCCYSIWTSQTRWFNFCTQRECYTNTSCNLINISCIQHTEYWILHIAYWILQQVCVYCICCFCECTSQLFTCHCKAALLRAFSHFLITCITFSTRNIMIVLLI